MIHCVLDWREPLAGSDEGLVLQASCHEVLLPGTSTVGSEGVEEATDLGFLAALPCQLAAGGPEELLLGAFTVGSEGVEWDTAGSRATATTVEIFVLFSARE